MTMQTIDAIRECWAEEMETQGRDIEVEAPGFMRLAYVVAAYVDDDTQLCSESEVALELLARILDNAARRLAYINDR